MNKFRVNLHPAFFSLEQEPSRESFNESVDSIKDELNTLKENILDKNKEKVTTIIGKLGENQRKEYLNDFSGRKADRNRFQTRLSEEENGQKNIEIWNGDICTGLGVLITQLVETGYFNGINGSKRETELGRIKDLYYKEVEDQFLKFVRNAGKKTYENNKKNLFKYTNKNSPASKIYKKLTDADSLYNSRNMAVDAYSTKILNSGNLEVDDEERGSSEPESGTMSAEDLKDITKENKKFLSRTLPAELWNLNLKLASGSEDLRRRDPSSWLNLQVINKIPFLNMIVSVSTYSESLHDREAIARFIDIASKISVPNGKIPEIELINMFAEMRSNSGKIEYEHALKVHGINLNGANFDDVMNAGKYYVRTQTIDRREQHPIYLSILQIIKDNGSINEAVKELKPIIEKLKEQNKTNKKEYKEGDGLDEDLKEFAEKLGMTDFTNIKRLVDLKQNTSDYFENNSVEQILANLNNDNMIAASDWQRLGNKSGNQFLEIYSRLDEKGQKKALKNLLTRARLESKIYGIEDALEGITDVESEVKNGNVKLIFLLQNIIANPGGDLYALLTSEEGKSLNTEHLEEEAELRDKMRNYAGQLLSEEKYQELLRKIKDNESDVASFASLQASMAACMYDNYKFGVGASVSFEEWVKGVKFEIGVQVRGKDKGVIGINMMYDPVIFQNNKWTIKGQLGGGILFPVEAPVRLKDLKLVLTGTAGITVDRVRMTDTGTAEHLGGELGTNVIVDKNISVSVYGGIHWFQDRIEKLEDAADIYKQKMETEMKTLLDERTGKLNVMGMRNDIQNWVNENGVKDDDVTNVTNEIMRILISYDGVDLDKSGITQTIASRVAEQYKLSRMERSKEQKKGMYFSGVALGGFLTLGSKGVRGGVYADVRMQKHFNDGYTDNTTRMQEHRDVSQTFSHSGVVGKRTEDRIKALNRSLRFETGGLEFEDGLVKIPASLVSRGMIKVGSDMRQKMFKDSDGNLYLSQWTPLHEEIVVGTGTLGRVLHVGNGENEFVLNNRVNDSRYTGKEALNKNMIIEMNKRLYTEGNLVKAINEVKSQNDFLRDFDDNLIEKACKDLSRFTNSDKEIKVILLRDKEGCKIKLESTVIQGSGFEIDYQVKLEMFDSKAKEIADRVYTQVSQIEDAEILNSVKHEKGRYYRNFINDYEEFVSAMGLYSGSTPDYELAREKIKNIFGMLDDFYSGDGIGTNFTSIGKSLDNLTGEELGQALLSVNNIFARSRKVIGDKDNDEKNRDYHFETTIGQIIKEREGQIYNTVSSVLDVDSPYLPLIEAMKKYREKKPQKFVSDTVRAVTNSNTVGLNLGDRKNPENWLLNPEYYAINVPLEDLVSEDFTREKINALHEKMMKNFATNDTLFYNIKKALGLPDSAPVKPGKFTPGLELGKKGKLVLDIGGKKVTLSADMSVGYFSQCVNHMVILENIQVESEDGLKVKYNSVTGGVESLNETSGGVRLGTWRMNVNFAFTGKHDTSEGGNSAVRTGNATEVGESSSSYPSNTSENSKTNPAGSGGGYNGGNNPV